MVLLPRCEESTSGWACMEGSATCVIIIEQNPNSQASNWNPSYPIHKQNSIACMHAFVFRLHNRSDQIIVMIDGYRILLFLPIPIIYQWTLRGLVHRSINWMFQFSGLSSLNLCDANDNVVQQHNFPCREETDCDWEASDYIQILQ